MRTQMKTASLVSIAFFALSLPVAAQVPVQVVVPAGVQQNPAGFMNINNDVWFGDHINGVLHYAPDDRANPNPLDTGTYHADLGSIFSSAFNVEGVLGSIFSFNYMGQVYRVNDTLALIAVPDGGRASTGKPVGGIYTLGFDPTQVFPVSPIGNTTQLVPDKGLGGSQPTSVALGPDGKQYFGNLKNPNLQRINGAQVESVGGALNGQPILSLAFNGSDIYLATRDGFYFVPSVPSCSGNQNNCGRPLLIAGGATVAVANDGLGHVYFAQSTGTVSRLNVGTQTISPVASGLSFGNITAGLGFDRNGNLWIGQLSEIDRILAADLALIP
jgi:hypothetical protein